MQTKEQEIRGMLDAYRCGWIQYDRNHVAQLQKELQQIIKNKTV